MIVHNLKIAYKMLFLYIVKVTQKTKTEAICGPLNSLKLKIPDRWQGCSRPRYKDTTGEVATAAEERVEDENEV